MKRHFLLKVSLLLLFCLTLIACSQNSSSSSPKEVKRLGIGTASTGGTFFPLGTGIAEIISKNSESLEVNAESTGGSVDNVNLIHGGETELALTDMSVAYTAINGEGDFQGEKLSDLRGVMMGYGQMIHILVKEDSPIQNVNDLKGKRISIGPAGSGTANTSKVLLDSLGIWDEVDIEYLTHEQESIALGDGRIDAATYVLGLPGSSVTEFLTTHKGRIIPVEKDVIELVQQTHPYYLQIPIPAGTYPGQDEEISSLGSRVALIADAKLDADTVYEVTKALMENIRELETYHPAGKEFTYEGALDGMMIPLHEGAKKYYEENNHPELK